MTLNLGKNLASPGPHFKLGLNQTYTASDKEPTYVFCPKNASLDLACKVSHIYIVVHFYQFINMINCKVQILMKIGLERHKKMWYNTIFFSVTKPEGWSVVTKMLKTKTVLRKCSVAGIYWLIADSVCFLVIFVNQLL